MPKDCSTVLRCSKVKVVLIKPGPTDASMTAQLKGKGAKLVPVGDIAKQIVAGVESGNPFICMPRKLLPIMMGIRNMPVFVFNQMDI